MSKEEFPVRPLGIYGRTYLLDEQTYRAYRAINIALYIIIGAIGLAGLLAPFFYKGPLWPPEAFVLAVTGVYVAGLSIFFTMVSRGRAISKDEADNSLQSASKHSSPRSFWFKSAMIVLCVVSGALLFLFSAGSIHKVITHQSVSLAELLVVFFILCSFVFLIGKLKERR